MSFLAPRVARQICLRGAAQYRVRSVVVARRTLHVTAVASAKKKKGDDDYDPFAPEAANEPDDLFGSLEPEPSSRQAEPSSSSVAAESGDPDKVEPAIRGDEPKKKKRFRLMAGVTPVKQSNRTFTQEYEFLEHVFSPNASKQEKATISPKRFRRMIMYARVDEDWVRARILVDKWQSELKTTDSDIERRLQIAYWILRRMAPKDKTTRTTYNEVGDEIVEVIAEDSDVTIERVPPKDWDLIESKFEWTMIEDPTTKTGWERVQFNAYYDQLMSRIRTKDKYLAPRDSILEMIKLAQHRTDLERVAEVLREWRSYRGKPDKEMTKDFLTRCQKLLEPTFAVQVLADRSRYGMDLADLKEVHALFHSILQTTTVAPEQSVTSAFQLAEVASSMPWRHVMQDPVSSVLLISICHRASKSSYAQQSMERGAQVLDELQAYLDTSKQKVKNKAKKKKETNRERGIYRQLGFVNRPKGMELTEKEKLWRAKSVEAARRFGEDLGLDVSWLTIPEHSQPAAETVQA